MTATTTMTVEDACRLLADQIGLLCEARARIADLTGERDQWREIAVVGIDELAALTRRVERQSETIARLCDELRHLRGEVAA